MTRPASLPPRLPRPAAHPAARPAALTLGLSLALALLAAPVPAAAAPATTVGSPSAAPAVAPRTVEGHTYAGAARLADTELLLNGVGLRAALKGFYKVYTAGLYLPRRLATPAAIYAEPGPRKLQMRMLIDGPSEEFAKAFLKGIAKSLTPEQIHAMQDRVDAVDRNMRAIGALHKGDVIDLDFTPAKGLVISVNGRVHGTPVAGLDLYNALLAIFLGERPLDKDLKDGLLGQAG